MKKQKQVVLFTRVSKEIASGLDAMVAQERKASAGRSISRADVVRSILLDAIDTAEKGALWTTPK